MNKTELVEKMVEKNPSVMKKDMSTYVDSFIDIIKESLSKGDNVRLSGFGTFDTVQRAEREGINPKTKETIAIPASKAVKFKVSKALKDAVNS